MNRYDRESTSLWDTPHGKVLAVLWFGFIVVFAGLGIYMLWKAGAL